MQLSFSRSIIQKTWKSPEKLEESTGKSCIFMQTGN